MKEISVPAPNIQAWECEYCGGRFRAYDECRIHEKNCCPKNPVLADVLDRFKHNEFVEFADGTLAFVNPTLPGTSTSGYVNIEYFTSRNVHGSWEGRAFSTSVITLKGLVSCRILTAEEFRDKAINLLDGFIEDHTAEKQDVKE